MSTQPSIPISDVLAIIRDNVTDATQRAAIAAELLKTQKQIAADKATAEPRGKTRLAVVLRDDTSTSALKDAVAAGCYVLSVPDPEDDTTLANTYMGAGLIGRIQTAARAHNEAPRKRRSKGKRIITTLHDAMTLLKAATIKGSGSAFGVKQKGTPVEIVLVPCADNLLKGDVAS